MNKIFTTLLTVGMLAGAAFTAKADLTVSAVAPQSPASYTVNSDSGYELTGFNISFSESGIVLDIANCHAYAKYIVNNDATTFPTELTVKTASSGKMLTVTVSNAAMSSYASFVSEGLSKGAQTFEIAISGLSSSANGGATGSNVENVKVQSGVIYLDYAYEQSSGGGGSSITWTPINSDGQTFTASASQGAELTTGLIQGAAYFVSNSSVDYSSYIDVYTSTSLSGAQGGMTAKVNDSGNYVYQFEWLSSAAGSLYFYYSGETPVDFTYNEGEFSGGGAAPSTTYTYGDSVTLGGSGNPTSADFKPSSNTYLSIVTDSQSAVDLELWYDIIPLDLTPVVMSNGYYAYNYDETLNTENTYVVRYSGSTPVQLTFNSSLAQGEVPVGPTYMQQLPSAYFDDDPAMPTFIIYWEEGIEAVSGDSSVAATLQTPDGTSLPVNMVVTAYYPDMEDGGTTGGTFMAENALLLPLSEYVADYGAGMYTVTLNAESVKNSAGEVNRKVEESFTVTVEELATGVVTPESGAVFEEGDEVTFTITFQGEVVANDAAEDVLYVYNGDTTYELRLDWTSADDVISVDGKMVVIELGEELAPGFYQGTFYNGAVFVDGVENEMVEFGFEVTEAETTGISSIESALNGSESIYNLQGVKVNKANLGKGLYIINGKKVVVK